jgi:hypothetical protein
MLALVVLWFGFPGPTVGNRTQRGLPRRRWRWQGDRMMLLAMVWAGDQFAWDRRRLLA